MEDRIVIERIQAMEKQFDAAAKAVADLDMALEQFAEARSAFASLIAYYESELWLHDFTADAEGKLPQDLKRGILSEDGIYNLLTDYQRLCGMIQEEDDAT